MPKRKAIKRLRVVEGKSPETEADFAREIVRLHRAKTGFNITLTRVRERIKRFIEKLVETKGKHAKSRLLTPNEVLKKCSKRDALHLLDLMIGKEKIRLQQIEQAEKLHAFQIRYYEFGTHLVDLDFAREMYENTLQDKEYIEHRIRELTALRKTIQHHGFSEHTAKEFLKFVYLP